MDKSQGSGAKDDWLYLQQLEREKVQWKKRYDEARSNEEADYAQGRMHGINWAIKIAKGQI